MADYIRTPYANDNRTMLDLMRLASADRSRADVQKAGLRSQGILNIGQLIAGTLASIREERDAKASMAAKAQQQAREDAFKQHDQELRELDINARIGDRQDATAARAEAATAKQRADGYKLGSDVAEEVQHGPMSEMQLDQVMQGPAAGRARYSFGPGTADGPELMPTKAQSDAISMREQLTKMGYAFGPNGQVIPPQKPAPPVRPVSVPDGGRLVNPETGEVTYQAPPRRDTTAPERPSVLLSKGTQQRYVTPTQADVMLQEGWVSGQTRENPTEDERKTVGFFKRMNDAISTMDAVEDKLSAQDIYQIQSLPQEDLIGAINRGKMSEPAKRYIRAMMQFTEARLRADSGAAIGKDEYVNDRQMYAKQYGETHDLNEDRRRARTIALEGLKSRAGRAMPKDDAPDQKTEDWIRDANGRLVKKGG